MKNVVCFKHPHYDPAVPPDLSCRTCCEKYVDRIKKTQDYFRHHGAIAHATFERRGGMRHR